jgi:hypothetical protein
MTPFPKPMPRIFPVLSLTFTHPAGTIPEGIFTEFPFRNFLTRASPMVTGGIKYRASSIVKIG